MPVADFGQLRALVEDSRDLFDDLVAQYKSDAPPLRQRIQDALATQDLPTLKRSAHALKGMLGVFAAGKSVAAAQQVEAQAGAGANCREAVADLELALDEFDTALQSYQW